MITLDILRCLISAILITFKSDSCCYGLVKDNKVDFKNLDKCGKLKCDAIVLDILPEYDENDTKNVETVQFLKPKRETTRNEHAESDIRYLRESLRTKRQAYPGYAPIYPQLWNPVQPAGQNNSFQPPKQNFTQTYPHSEYNQNNGFHPSRQNFTQGYPYSGYNQNNGFQPSRQNFTQGYPHSGYNQNNGFHTSRQNFTQGFLHSGNNQNNGFHPSRQNFTQGNPHSGYNQNNGFQPSRQNFTQGYPHSGHNPDRYNASAPGNHSSNYPHSSGSGFPNSQRPNNFSMNNTNNKYPNYYPSSPNSYPGNSNTNLGSNTNSLISSYNVTAGLRQNQNYTIGGKHPIINNFTSWDAINQNQHLNNNRFNLNNSRPNYPPYNGYPSTGNHQFGYNHSHLGLYNSSTGLRLYQNNNTYSPGLPNNPGYVNNGPNQSPYTQNNTQYGSSIQRPQWPHVTHSPNPSYNPLQGLILNGTTYPNYQPNSAIHFPTSSPPPNQMPYDQPLYNNNPSTNLANYPGVPNNSNPSFNYRNGGLDQNFYYPVNNNTDLNYDPRKHPLQDFSYHK